MKYRVKDNDREYEVEEIVSDEELEETETETVETEDDDQALTSDEISALKELAKIAPKLMELINSSTTDEEEEETEEVITDEDEDEEEEEIETKPKHDSKSSFGSIEKSKKKLDDSIEEDEIANAWAKRYGGTK